MQCSAVPTILLNHDQRRLWNDVDAVGSQAGVRETWEWIS